MTHKRIKARPTEYNGVVYDSKSEAVFAKALDDAGFVSVYHPQDVKSPHVWDFLSVAPETGVPFLIEYKPVMPTQTYLMQLYERACEEDRRAFLVYGNPWDGKPYIAFPLLRGREDSVVKFCYGITKADGFKAKQYRFDLEAAKLVIEFYKRNFGARLFPLRKRKLNDDSSKRPLHKGWQTRDYTAEELNDFLSKGHGIGWALGPNDLVVDIDVNRDKTGDKSFDKLVKQVGPIESLEVKSPTGGRHIYLIKPSDAKIDAKIADFPGIDIKTNGGYVVIAGSPHWQGGEYEFVDDTVERSVCPPKLFERLEKKTSEKELTEDDRVEGDKLEKLLALLDPIDYADNDLWFPILCASHSATNGKGEEIFVDWCLQDSEYIGQEDEIRNRWNSLSDKTNSITIATLIKEIHNAGGEWQADEILGRFEATEAKDDFAHRLGEETDIFAQEDDDLPKNFPQLQDADFNVEFIVDRVLIEGEPMILAGPEKSFKTTTLLDLSLSIAFGVPFLGEYEVPKPRRVLFCCGETSSPTIKRNAAAILKSKGVSLKDPNGAQLVFRSYSTVYR